MKKTIIYSSHLNFRLKVRELSFDLPTKILESSKEIYFDNKTGYSIALDKVFFKNKWRDITVVFKELADRIIVITIHPIRPYDRYNKIRSGRWVKK